MSGASSNELADEVLLERYTSKREEAAFAVLVRRYGPLVLGVCRRVLQHEQDAEDAFQAVFCVLARRAGSIRRRGTVGAWLHAVAYRIALKARKAKARRPLSATNLADIPAAADSPEWAWRELRPVLDEEVNRLPEKYRRTFVLCYLEGRTNEQAAAQLGCPLGTVLSRLARARQKLRGRLTRRGLALSAGTLAVVLADQAAGAVVPPALADAAIQATAAFMSGGTTAGALSTSVSASAEEFLRFSLRARLVRIAATLLTAFVAGVLLLLLYRGGAGRAVALRTDQQLLQGTWGVSEIEAGGAAGLGPGLQMQMSFTGEECTLSSNILPPIRARYQLNPNRTPKEITLSPRPDITWPGIYLLDGDSLRICLNQGDQGGLERPTEFTSRAGPNVFVYVLKRESTVPGPSGPQRGGVP